MLVQGAREECFGRRGCFEDSLILLCKLGKVKGLARKCILSLCLSPCTITWHGIISQWALENIYHKC